MDKVFAEVIKVVASLPAGATFDQVMEGVKGKLSQEEREFLLEFAMLMKDSPYKG